MPNNSPRAWSPEDDATFRRMWQERASIDVIGAAVGRTRNAVASRRKRLGLLQRVPSQPGCRGGAQNAARTPAERRVTSQLTRINRTAKNGGIDPWNGGRVKPATPKSAPKPLPALPSAAPSKSIADLEHRQCRYIGERPALLTLDTVIYCGAVTNGGPWCQTHRAVVYRPR